MKLTIFQNILKKMFQKKRFLGKDKIVEESRKNLNREEKVIIKSETKKTEKLLQKKQKLQNQKMMNGKLFKQKRCIIQPKNIDFYQ